MKRISVARLVLVFLCAIPLLGARKCDSAEEKQAVVNDMVVAFKDGCGMGSWTQASLSRASQLSAIYQSLLAKASCSSNPNVRKALDSSLALQGELQAMQGAEAQSQMRVWDETSNDLLIALQQNGNPALQPGLISQYVTSRYNLSYSRARANYIANPGYRQQLTYGFESLNVHFRNLLAASNSLAECYADNPNVAIQLAAGLAEMGGSFAPPMYGLAISAVSNLLKVAVQAAVMAPSADAVYDVARIEMPTALTCGLEAMSRDYCKAKNAATLLNIRTKGKDGKPLPFFAGIDLQDRYMPALYRWLDLVLTGNGTIHDPNEAQMVNLQFKRIGTALASKRSADGIFADLQRKFQDLHPDPGTAVSLLRGIYRQLLPLFYGIDMSTGSFAAPPESVFYGFEGPMDFVKALAPNGAPDGATNLEQLVSSLEIHPDDLPAIQNLFLSLYERRYGAVVAEFNRKVHVAPSTIVREASRSDLNGLSALISWQKLYKFFRDYPYQPDFRGEQDRIIVSELKASMDSVYSQLIDPNSVSETCPARPRSNPGVCVPPATQVLTSAYNTFKLENNNVFLPTKVGDLVRTDLTIRYQRGDVPKDVKDLFRLAGQDLTLLLQRAHLSPADVQSDISMGQSISTRTVDQFRTFYMAGIRRAMEDLREAADRNREPPSGDTAAPNRNALAKLCVLTYISGMSWPAEIDQRYCNDAVLVSQAAGLKLRFTKLLKQLNGKTLDDRICAYENFLRADRLASQEIQPPSDGRLLGAEGVPATESASLRERARGFWQQYLEQ